MDTSSQEFYARVEEVVQREVAEGGLEPELPYLHPRNPSPFETVPWSSSSSVEGYAHGSPCPIDYIVGVILV